MEQVTTRICLTSKKLTFWWNYVGSFENMQLTYDLGTLQRFKSWVYFKWKKNFKQND
jgi:hypothetical protein